MKKRYVGITEAKNYIEGKITLSHAAKQANLTLWDMKKYLIEKSYKSYYSLEDLEREINPPQTVS
ncbi:MAG: hypothetical protein AABX59_01265 [Nanoarchaeota archaeon]